MGLVASLSYAGLAGGAFGPASDALGDLGKPAAEIARATLSYQDGAPVITGSVAHLFDTAMFNGPNQDGKSGRYRPPVDVVAFASNFETARMQIAALRTPADPTDLGQSRLADAGEPAVEDGPRMSVAAINPSAAAALDAIAGIAPQTASLGVAPVVPVPAQESEQLAYARADAPISTELPTPEATQVSDRELWCLATAVYFEARGESYRGQVAVAQVVMNRVKDHRYPDTICGVVFQNQNRRNACQFSFACDGIPEVVNEQRPWAQAEEIATGVTSGELYLTEVGDSTHYHATYVRPAWAPRMEKVTQIGLHVFYKFKRGWLFG